MSFCLVILHLRAWTKRIHSEGKDCYTHYMHSLRAKCILGPRSWHFFFFWVTIDWFWNRIMNIDLRFPADRPISDDAKDLIGRVSLCNIKIAGFLICGTDCWDLFTVFAASSEGLFQEALSWEDNGAPFYCKECRSHRNLQEVAASFVSQN